jgi:hypothetical protein
MKYDMQAEWHLYSKYYTQFWCKYIAILTGKYEDNFLRSIMSRHGVIYILTYSMEQNII